MKKARKLIPAIAMLLMSAVMLTTSSYAWFSMNTTVSATGMSVEAKATGSLLIAISHDGTYSTAASFTGGAKTLSPCSYLNYTPDNGTETTGYAYVTNPSAVDPNTGFAIDSTNNPLKYAAAAANTHYVDYIVYIKAEGADVNLSKLEVAVDFGTTTLGQLATTVDFWISNTAGVVSTYNVTHEKTVGADDTTKKIDLGALNMTDGSAYPIVMRVYVDGAATGSGATQAHVNSADGNVSNVSIGVTFVGTTATTQG